LQTRLGVLAVSDEDLGNEAPKRSLATSSQLASTDVLQAYLAETRKHPVLSAEDERALAERYVNDGDPLAGQALVSANLRLVVKLAFQYHREWSSVLDLIQEGNVGLMEALKKFDPYRGVRFSSYAQYWIRAMILRFLMDNYRIVRLGTTRSGRKLFFQLQKERNRLLEAGYVPSTLRIAENLDVPESEVILMDQQLSHPVRSIHAAVGQADERMLEETVSVEDQLGTDDAAAENEMGKRIQVQLKAFRAGLKGRRERSIWDDRLTALDPKSLSALGRQFDVSKERIRQIESRMRSDLKKQLEQALGDAIDFSFRLPQEGE
jgi:RNA polymerase sigma-32 factor